MPGYFKIYLYHTQKLKFKTLDFKNMLTTEITRKGVLAI